MNMIHDFMSLKSTRDPVQGTCTITRTHGPIHSEPLLQQVHHISAGRIGANRCAKTGEKGETPSLSKWRTVGVSGKTSIKHA